MQLGICLLAAFVAATVTAAPYENYNEDQWRQFRIEIEFEFYTVSTKMRDLTFLPMSNIRTDASVSSYIFKKVSYANDLIPDNYG